MSGWTAICLILLGLHVNEPLVVIIACAAFLFGYTPSQRLDKLEKQIAELKKQSDLRDLYADT